MVSVKIADIDVSETSGVDHPAHLAEGWVILKSEAVTEEVDESKGGFVAETEVHETTKAETADEGTSGDELAKAQARIAELEAQIAELSKADEAEQEPSPDEMLKELPEELRKRLEDAEETARQNADELRKERELRRDREYIQKVADELPSLNVVPDEFGPVLRSLEDADSDLFEKVYGVLKAANAQAESGELFSEIGSSQSDEADGVWAEIEKRARKLVSDGAVGTFEKAISTVLEVDSRLYDDYKAEVK